MEDYVSNSHKSREGLATKPHQEERKKVEKVITGTAKRRKKSQGEKLLKSFVTEDIGTVKDYLVGDVLIPALQNLLLDLLNNGASMLFKGNVNRGSRPVGTRVSYSNYYGSGSQRQQAQQIRRAAERYDFNDIILESRAEAEDVLNTLYDLIDEYRMVTVADLYDLIGETSNWTDNKYGWTNLNSADVVRTREGYLLKLPKAKPLDN